MTYSSPVDDKPDSLRDLYRQAVEDDAGPSAEVNQRVIAYARERAAQPKLAPSGAPAITAKADQAHKPAANDRHWLRHAFGGLAALGLVGWLMLQHAAWWDGSDKGIGADPASQAHERQVPAAPASSSPSSAQAEPAQSELAHADAEASPVSAEADAATDASSAAAAPVNPRSTASSAARAASKAAPAADHSAKASGVASEVASESTAQSAPPPAANPSASAKMRSSQAAPSHATDERAVQDASVMPVAPVTPAATAAPAPANSSMMEKSAPSANASKESTRLPTCTDAQQALLDRLTEQAADGVEAKLQAPRCQPQDPLKAKAARHSKPSAVVAPTDSQ